MIGVGRGLARFAGSHGSWDSPDVAVEDLLVSVADKVWKAKRVPDLEQLLVERLVAVSGQQPWAVFLALDDELDAVLAAIATDGVDLTVNLGDLLSGYVQPVETADRLIGIGLPTVAGNHERQVLTLPGDRQGMADRLTAGLIGTAHREWLGSLPVTLSPAPGVLAFHGTPTDDLQYLLHTVEPGGVRDATLDEVRARVGDVSGYGLLLCGHTHLPGMLRLPDGPLIVNPGSVGWPAYVDDAPFAHEMAAGSPHARYALVDDASGRWEAQLRAVDYPWEDAAVLAEGFGRPDVARALRTGRN